jgi:hypothetical protein
MQKMDQLVVQSNAMSRMNNPSHPGEGLRECIPEGEIIKVADFFRGCKSPSVKRDFRRSIPQLKNVLR